MKAALIIVGLGAAALSAAVLSSLPDDGSMMSTASAFAEGYGPGGSGTRFATDTRTLSVGGEATAKADVDETRQMLRLLNGND